jgi:hypothetical protein
MNMALRITLVNSKDHYMTPVERNAAKYMIEHKMKTGETKLKRYYLESIGDGNYKFNVWDKENGKWHDKPSRNIIRVTK